MAKQKKKKRASKKRKTPANPQQKAKELMADALKEWEPDVTATSSEPKDGKSEKVTLIEKPFDLSIQEASDAQELPEDSEIPLDEDEANEGEFEIESDSETERHLKSLEERLSAEEEDEKEQLIRHESELSLEEQIQEDEEVEAEQRASRQAQKKEKLQTSDLPSLADIDEAELQSYIETLLFLSDKPLSTKRIKDMIGEDCPTPQLKKALKSMIERYASSEHGIEVVEIDGGYQFRTKPGKAHLARKLSKVIPHRLSRGAMETLAIIAYKQPVMKEEIDSIRGVDSSHFIRGLLEKKLIHISGRSELPGRPMLYKTTSDFVEVFGLSNLDALPALREIEQMIPTSESDQPSEDPNIQKLRSLVSQMNMDRGNLDYNPADDEQILSDIRQTISSQNTSTPTLNQEKEEKREKKKAAKQKEETIQELPIQPPAFPSSEEPSNLPGSE